MGLFSTNKEEEAKLREIANQQRDELKSDHRSFTGSSAYETADEDMSEDGRPYSQDLSLPSAQVSDQHRDPSVTTEGNHNNDDDELNFHNNEEGIPNDANDNFGHDSHTTTTSSPSIKGDGDGKENQDSATSEDQPAPINAKSLDWDDENDPGNPKNWPKWKKWYVTFTTASICLCVSLGSSLFVAGVFELSREFRVSQELCISGLTFYLLGLAFGPAIAAPLSETFGRSITYIGSFPISMLFTMGVGLSDKIYQVLILRFFSGLFASPALAVAAGSIQDIWDAHELGLAMALFCLAPFLGPVLGPIVGGFAAEHKGWKWTMWVSLMFSGAVLPFVLFLPETYKPVVLTRRAKKRGTPLYSMPLLALLKFTLLVTLLKPVQMLVVEPIVLVWSFYIAVIFAVLFGFFEAFPIIFQGQYGMGLGVSGLPFIAVGIGLLSGVVFYIIYNNKVLIPLNPDGSRGIRNEKGQLIPGTPKDILFVGKLGALCLPVSLFWLGWTGRSDIHWLCPTAAGILFGLGMILIFFSNIAYFTICFPPLSLASALGANNLLRYILASVFPLFTSQMYENIGIDWGSSVFAFISVACLPIPWLFEYYGPKLSSRSKFGYVALIREKEAEEAKLKQANEEEKRKLEQDELEQDMKEERVEEAVGVDPQRSNFSRHDTRSVDHQV